ncbi:MAG: SIS domain-containing protein, partial [Solirubrobacterales bacterium]|nr:SIS domain-containing protein [Solirubrobacterales bacterium]
VADAIRAFKPRFVVIAARGTSDHAALYAKYLVEVVHQLPAGLASPSTMTLYGARPDMRDVLFIAISQSGRSPDLVESTEVARARGACTVAVTNNLASPLAAAAAHAVDVHAGAEQAVAATKSYTAQLMALALMLGGSSASKAELLPEAATATLAANPSDRVAALAARLRYVDRLVLTARGYSYPTAREAALKLMETSYLAAQAFSGADFLHGPLAIVDSSVPAVAIASGGHSAAATRQIVSRLEAAGAEVITVGAAGELALAGPALGEELSPIVEILPLQRLALELALLRGHDPDTPRGLMKITETR